MGGVDELADWRSLRQGRVDAAIRAAGLHPPVRLNEHLAVTVDPAADPDVIRFVAPDGTGDAVVRLAPELRVRLLR